jgi:O-antigen/teichoic acid export membrane protein
LEHLISRGSDVFYSMLARRDEADRTPFFQRTARRVALYLLPLLFVGAMVAPLVFKLIYPAKFHGAAVLLGLLVVRLIMRATSQVQFMHLMMRAEVYLATRAYLVSFVVLVATFVVWVEVLGLGVVGLAVSAVVAMTTFTLAQTLQLVWRRELSPWPAIAALLWTGLGMAGVLLVYGTG